MLTRTERQRMGVNKWLDANGIGLLCYCTGFGKTRTSIMVIKSLIAYNPHARVLISVPTNILKEQWIKDLVENQVFFNCKVEVINTIIKSQWDVDLFVIDEIHGTPTTTFGKVFTNVKYEMILGLTGTLERLDGKESIIKKYCPVVDTVTVEEAVANSWVSPYKEYKVLVDVDLTEYREMSRKFNGYFAYFDYNFNLAMNCATDVIFRNTYAKKMGLDHKQVTAMAMDWLRCMHWRNNFVKSHPKKFEIAKRILNKRTDKKCITFSATIKDSESIKIGYTLHSKKSKKKNEETLAKFNAQMFGVINTSKAADVGADIAGLSVGIVISGDSSKIRKGQRRGRAIRFEEGKEAEMFTLVIRGTQEESWYNNASSGSNYITINEEQLEDVLDYKEIEVRKRENITNIQFRF